MAYTNMSYLANVILLIFAILRMSSEWQKLVWENKEERDKTVISFDKKFKCLIV